MNERVYWVEHKGTRILVGDYSRLSGQDYVVAIQAFEDELAGQTPGSVCTISVVTDSTVTTEVKDKFKEMSERTQGISKAASTVGLSGFKKALAVLIRKDLYWADSLEDAKDWLVEQAAAG